jgi:transcriptional regulator with XRE-family HTH domain
MVALPFCHVTLRGQIARRGRDIHAEPKTLGAWIWKRRTQLGLTQRELAARLGVHPETPGKWEGDRQRPRANQFATLCNLLGKPADGITPAPNTLRPHQRRGPASKLPHELRTLGDHLRKRRLALGLVQAEAAARMGVHALTVKNWERGLTVPTIQHQGQIVGFLEYAPWDESQ